MNIYSDPQLYDAIHHNYKWDIKLIQSFAKRSKGRVLELASGTGRLAQPIINLGMDYTGLELSKPFLNKAEEKYAGNAKFVLGDMRNFDLGSHFNLIFIGFNSFLHNLTLSDARNCLKCIRKHLSIKGRFLLSIFIPDPLFLHRDNDMLYPATDYFQFQNSRCRIMEKNQYDPDSQINNLIWFIERDGELELEEYNYSMRMFYPQEMDILLFESGFFIEEKFGDYDQSPLDPDSGLQIYVCDAV